MINPIHAYNFYAHRKLVSDAIKRALEREAFNKKRK